MGTLAYLVFWQNKNRSICSGFPVGGGGGGGADPFGETPNSDADDFWRKHVRKQKNWIPLGGPGGAPWICQ